MSEGIGKGTGGTVRVEYDWAAVNVPPSALPSGLTLIGLLKRLVVVLEKLEAKLDAPDHPSSG